MENKNISGSFVTDYAEDGIKGKCTVFYDFGWVGNTSQQYNHTLAKFCSQLCMLGYDDSFEDEKRSTGYEFTKPNLKAALEKMSFTDIVINPRATRDQVNFFIAQREVDLPQGEYRLVFAGFIGSYRRQWYSNFDPYGWEREANDGKGYAGDAEKGRVHLGFADARSYVYEKLDNYLTSHKSDRETKYLLIGHSRGAATANLLAGGILSEGRLGKTEIKADNLFTYTFATPNAIILTDEEKSNPVFSRIYNIVNPEDYVTAVLPEAWGFTKYGTVYTLPSKSFFKPVTYEFYKNSMQKYYAKFRGNMAYTPFKKGIEKTAKATRVLAEGINGLEGFYYDKQKELREMRTPFEYFKVTLCPYVAGVSNEEEQKAKDEATKLILASSYDPVATSYTFRNLSKFFVEMEGIGSVTGGKISSTYFSDSHRAVAYCAYMLSLTKEALIRDTDIEESEEDE